MRSIERLRRIQPSAAIGVAALAVVATLVAAGGLARAAFPGRNGRVAFTSNRTGHYQVFTMRPDGSHVRQLTHRGFCSEPSFSANGRSIAFADDKDVFTMHADGTHVHRVTHTAAGVIAGNPTFTPSGHRIAYMADPAGPTRNQIFAIDTNGSHRHALTPATVDSETPSVSPNGKRIAFVRPTPPSYALNVFVMRADGSHVRRVTHSSTDAEDPSFSPNGRQIVFARGFNTNVFVVDVSGSHLRRLTHATGDEEDLAPVFSPNGRKIAFQLGKFGTPEGTAQIAKMDVDGSHRHKLTHTGHRSVNVGPPSWQPLPRR